MTFSTNCSPSSLPVKRVTVIVVLVLASVASAAPARAGVYEVFACGGAAGGAQNAFVAAADGNMSAYSICPPVLHSMFRLCQPSQ